MNNRDPFGIHRNPTINILRAAATQAALDIKDKAIEAGAHAIEKGKQAVEDMSYSIPKNVPSFGNPQRLQEDRLWAASARSGRPGGGILGGVHDILDPRRKNSLPMYKDKPYAYPPSYRVRPLYRRKRVLTLLFVLGVTLLYYFGFLDEHKEKVQGSLQKWNWINNKEKAKSKADWLKRRERVVEAFELSWDAYARYAWGKTA